MFKNKKTRNISLLVALVLITSLFVGGTIARYVTSTSSEDEARVAVWGINDGGTTMDLFDASYELNGTKIAESGDGDNIIAPGTGKMSKFKIVEADANLAPEVMYEIRINLDDSQIADAIKNNPSIQWKVNDGNWGTWEELKNSLLLLSGDASGVKAYAPGTVAPNFANGTEHTISWQWLMDNNNDVMDTEMGNLAATEDITAKLKIEVIARQTDVDTTGMLEGNGSTYYIHDPQVLTFRADADINTFDGVKINGTEINESNYTTAPGSIIVKLKTDYLDTLELGKYTVSIQTTEKDINAQFNVVDDKNLIHNNVIPEGAIYYTDLTPSSGDYYYENADLTGATTYNPGDKFPTPKTGDIYIYRDFEYRYNAKYLGSPWQKDETLNGWSAKVIDKTKSSYTSILSTINGKDIVNLDGTFTNCTNLINPPVISVKVKSLVNTFAGCSSLKTAPNISNTVTNMLGTFGNCSSLTEIPVIPSSVKIFEHAFYNCSNLTGTIEINSNNITSYTNSLKGTGITNIIGSISEELKRKIAANSSIVLIENGPDSNNTGVYYTGITSDTISSGNYTGHTVKYTNGAFPETPTIGDVYVHNGYEYRYGMIVEYSRWVRNGATDDAWGVLALDKTKSEYPDILSHINGRPVTNMHYCFVNCTNLTKAPTIPDTITIMTSAFSGCTSLTTPPVIPNTVTNMAGTFTSCTSLTTAPKIPASVKNVNYTFAECSNLTTIEVNTNPTTYTGMLYHSGVTEITGSTTMKDELLTTVSTL